MTRSEIIEAIKIYERERNGVTALHPERYMDLAEYLELKSREERDEIYKQWDSVFSAPHGIDPATMPMGAQGAYRNYNRYWERDLKP